MAPLDPVIHQATRLRIMTALHRNREASFTRLRDGLGLTDGNLHSHAAALERAGYVEARRVLAGLSFEVRYRITAKGSEAFRAYARELLSLLSEELPPEGATRPPPAPPAPPGPAGGAQASLATGAEAAR